MAPKRRRVPVTLQASSVDCGVACLTMILNYYGAGTSLQECRRKCDPGRSGLSAKALLQAARAGGLTSEAFSTTARAICELQLPAIVHWQGKHFVVVECWSRETFHIIDPACGRQALKLEQFEAGFTGVALTFQPTPELQRTPRRDSRSRVRYLRRFLQVDGARALLARILLASILLQLLGLAVPVFSKLLVDRVLASRLTSELNILGLCAIAVAFSQAAMSYFRSRALIALETRVDSSLMLGFFEHLMRLPFRFFQHRNSGDLLMRLGSNGSVRDALAGYTVSAIIDGSLVLVYAAALLKIAPLFGIAALAFAAIQVVIMMLTAQRLQHLVKNDIACQSASQSYLVEVLMGVSSLKASGAENRVLNCWKELLSKQMNASVGRSRYSAGVDATVTLVKTFAPLCLLWVGGTEVLRGTMTLGTMIGINAVAAALLVPVGSLILSAQRLHLAGAHLERIKDVMEAAPEQDPARAQAAPKLRGDIEVRRVSFRYDADGPLALRDVSFTVRSGQKVALVGPSGSGKSTLAKLLLGLYQPESGQILFDGLPLNELDLRSVRNQWGAVLQEPFLFSGSVRENLSYHDSQVPMESIMGAAALAAIHDDVLAMPMGYETTLDELGSSFSGGQRQRMAIARAIVRQPAMLLLDEATSHLDTLTENMIDRNLDCLSCSRIVIAHRMSTVRNADLILVLDGGGIVERGTHDELIARNSMYAALAQAQQPALEIEAVAARLAGSHM